MGTKNQANHYLWFDTEYSTLDLERADLLQIALVVTDARLRRVRPPEKDLNLDILYTGKAGAWVEENLAELLGRCRSEKAVPVEEADTRLAEAIDEIFGAPSKEIRMRPVLAGNSVHTDWFLARRFLPKFLDRMHYRLLDVTTVKLEWLRWFRGAGFDKEKPAQIRRYFSGAHLTAALGPHDAYYDAQASIAELGYYRARLQKNNGAGS